MFVFSILTQTTFSIRRRHSHFSNPSHFVNETDFRLLEYKGGKLVITL